MYKLTNITENNLSFIELKNSTQNTFAKIALDQGGSLEQLTLNEKTLIANLNPLKYEDTYASSILFPFANRIKNGKYTFENNSYTLNCNEKGNNNALHGLVHDKSFKCIGSELNSEFAQITLNYEDDNKVEGFPFKYAISLTYKLSKSGINLTITITNLDQQPFPFTLGWHPYFKSADLYNSSLSFNCDKKLKFDSQLITAGIIDFKNEMPFQIKDQQLDDGFILASNSITFKTPGYEMAITSSAKDNFLQLYTPNNPNIIAIEPTTGVSDSFNNKLGLQQLNPEQDYTLQWTVTIKS